MTGVSSCFTNEAANSWTLATEYRVIKRPLKYHSSTLYYFNFRQTLSSNWHNVEPLNFVASDVLLPRRKYVRYLKARHS